MNTRLDPDPRLDCAAPPGFRLDDRMRRLAGIERAIEQLAPAHFPELAQRISALQRERWNRQLDGGAAQGRLDFFVEEARDGKQSHLLKDWP